MNARLIVEKNHQRVRSIPLKPAGMTLGRSEDADVRIPSAEVSRRHCRLRAQNGVVYLQDLSSVNGTYLNGQPVVGDWQVVHPGGRVQIGPITLLVEYEPTPEGRALLGDDAADVLEVVEGDVGVSIPVAMDDEPLPLVDDLDDLPTAKVLDDDEPLDLPSGTDLRDLLEDMEQEHKALPKKRKK
jgi:pSer/pThr/pTyr-binding forkhead associated (FHA) protein